MRRPSPPALVSVVVVAAACAFVLVPLQPSLLLADTTTSGGDTGAHVWGPAFLRDHLLPHGRLTGWAPDWYAGFPALHFYFPLPSLLVVLVDLVLPYTIAFKLVTVAGLVAMPLAAWAFGRLGGLPFPAPPLLATATLPFVFDRFHTIWGGNAASTLAGEFSFSMAVSLALVFLGVLARGLETGRHRVLAGVLLACTGLSHLIPAAFAVGGAGVLLLLCRPSRRRWVFVATVGALGFSLAAFWLVPFLARLPYSNDMGWERTPQYVTHLLPFLSPCDPAGCAPGEQFFQRAHTAHLKVVAPLAALGAVVGLVRRRRTAAALAAMAALTAAAFRFVPEGPIWNARVLPFWYLCLYLLAAIAVAELGLLLAGPPATDGRASPLVAFLVPLVALATVVIAVGAPLGVLPSWTGISTADRSFIPDWARWNYSGYERKDAYAEYRAVVDTMADVGRRHGCGRAMWEYEAELNRYGTPMALMLLPMWTDGCIGSMEGLYFESSATVPYHFLNQSELSLAPSRAMRDLPYRELDVAAGVEHLRLLGVRYYMALTPEAQAQAAADPGLRLVASTPAVPVSYPDGVKERSWQVYEVAGSELVEPLGHEPVVVTCCVGGKESWLRLAVDWYQDSSRWPVPLAAGGPPEWRRVPSPTADPPRTPVPPTVVSGIRTGDDRISFDVDRPGVPVLVKVSYFPNWKASGAKGPWRVTPNLMVVVPTGRHVELRYGWTPVDLGGWALTLLGLAAVLVLARRGPVHFPKPLPPPDAPAGAPEAGPREPEREPAEVPASA
jgi:hypothetical protein